VILGGAQAAAQRLCFCIEDLCVVAARVAAAEQRIAAMT